MYIYHVSKNFDNIHISCYIYALSKYINTYISLTVRYTKFIISLIANTDEKCPHIKYNVEMCVNISPLY